MNNTANSIKQRLSLREPLQDSLDIIAQLGDVLTLKKCPSEQDEATAFLQDELQKVNALFPTCTQFDREFTSIAFSISPLVTVRAFLQSIIPAPVASRSSFTI